LVKELQFEKLTPALVRQLREDPDVTGRLWALQELHERGAKDKGVDAAPIRAAVAEALVKDEFWGVRLEAADTLKAVGSDGQQEALVAATKDPDARVRAAVIRALASTKDAKFATVYLGLLDDQSYDVIEEAATALGQTHDPGAFEALSKLAETPSWHDNIRASALIGLAALGDVRALPLAKRYAAIGNRLNVRAAATALLGSTAGKDPEAYPLISSALTQALGIRSQELWQSAAAALVATGDHRAAEACTLMRQRFKDPEESEQISALEKQLKKKREQACSPR
jgi:aminopeptidase N